MLLQDDDEIKKLDTSGTKSKLPRQVQDLVKMIFDVESMTKTMLEFEVRQFGIVQCSSALLVLKSYKYNR